jgi:hypothetical protein
MKIYDQTGRVFWDSTGDDGQPNSFPIQQLPNNVNVAQLNTLISQYNFNLERLREEMGISEYRDGSSVPVKTGLGVMQQQIQSSNSATEYIYDAFTNVMEETTEKVSMMLWDSVVFKAAKYKEMEGYDLSLLDMSFDVKVEMLPDDQKKAELNNLMMQALQSGALTYEQVFKIKNIDDVKLAELYLAKSMKKAKREAEEAAQKNSQMNAQIQQQSAQMKMQQDAQLVQMESQGKMAVNKTKGDSDKDLELIKFATTMYMESLKTGQPLPDEIKAMADSILGSAVQEQMQQKQQEQMAQQQAQQQEAQQQEQSQVPEQGSE